MVDTTLLSIIYILFYALMGITIITFALIFYLILIISKQN